jgi:cell division septation protein DedD
MEPALKQRLVGAAVLVALAVIFLPMLVQGPAPDSGVADVPLDVPDAPAGGFETRELPLLGPSGATPQAGALGMTPSSAQAAPADAELLPQVDATPPDMAPVDEVADSDAAPEPATPPPAAPAAPPAEPAPMFPAATAGGDYAVSWGSFSTVASADASVASLRASQLPAWREAATVGGKTVQRVRIGPYASRAEAEAARLRAAHVRDDMNAQVITLDAAPVPTTAAKAATPAKPAAAAPKPAVAAGTGFAVQLAAFSTQADADALVARARAAGFRAFTESVATADGKLVRVRVGPVSTRAEADALQVQVRGRLGIDGLVRSHP